MTNTVWKVVAQVSAFLIVAGIVSEAYPVDNLELEQEIMEILSKRVNAFDEMPRTSTTEPPEWGWTLYIQSVDVEKAEEVSPMDQDVHPNIPNLISPALYELYSNELAPSNMDKAWQAYIENSE